MSSGKGYIYGTFSRNQRRKIVQRSIETSSSQAAAEARIPDARVWRWRREFAYEFPELAHLRNHVIADESIPGRNSGPSAADVRVQTFSLSVNEAMYAQLRTWLLEASALLELETELYARLEAILETVGGSDE